MGSCISLKFKGHISDGEWLIFMLEEIIKDSNLFYVRILWADVYGIPYYGADCPDDPFKIYFKNYLFLEFVELFKSITEIVELVIVLDKELDNLIINEDFFTSNIDDNLNNSNFLDNQKPQYCVDILEGDFNLWQKG